jgi:VWFA-related protein
LIVLSAAAVAQETTPAVPQITVVSQLVVLDTVVTDRKRKIVTTLTKDDFSVYENGVLQTIRDFSSPADLPAVPNEPIQDRNGHDTWGASPLTMIVVDEMDTPFQELAYARDCVRNYLKKQPAQLVQPTILLWLDDNGIHPLTGFIRDRDTMLRALAKQPPSLAGRLARGAFAEQVSAAFAALQQAALFSRGQPGKKEIILVGRSFPSIDPIGLDDYQRTLLTKAVRSTVDLLLASRVSVYVIDPTITGSAINDDIPQEFDTLTPVPATSVKDPFAGTFNINLFVGETGGRYFRGFNDIDRQINESVQRGATYYTLSYVPGTQLRDGSYRRIDIRLRNPHPIAQARKGYYAGLGELEPQTKLTAKLDLTELRFDLYEASVTGMEYTGLGVHVEGCARDADKIRSICTVSIDTGSLTFTPTDKGDKRTMVLGVLSSLDAKGKLINSTIERLAIAIPENRINEVSSGHSVLALQTIVPPSARLFA